MSETTGPASWVRSVYEDVRLAHDFLSTFARFEFALKAAGYLKGDEKRAEADWDRFGDAVQGWSLAVSKIAGPVHGLQKGEVP